MGRALSVTPSSRCVTASRVPLGVESLKERFAPSALFDPLGEAPASDSPEPPPDLPTAAAPAQVAGADGTAGPAPPTPAPDMAGGETAVAGPSASVSFLLVAANQPPRVANFMAVEVAGGAYEFSGDVLDETPGGLTVTLGGEPDSLQGVTTTTDATGHFVVAVLVRTDGSDNGLATAQTVDTAGLASNVASYAIWPG